MFGIRHYQAEPATWVRLVRDGRTVREGVGLSLWRWGSGSTLIAVPCGLRASALLGSLGVRALAVHVDVLRDCLLGGTALAPADPVVVSDVSPSHPLASAWRRELALAARFGPRFPRGVA